jgi:hypothetical protein
MSSQAVAALLGSQTPRIALVPRAKRSDGDDAAFLASRYGLTPDPWQAAILESWLGLRQDGRFAAQRCGLAVPRQNGKNAVIEIRELFGMIVLGEKILHTAHEVKTARKAFLRLCSFFENPRRYPELADLVRDVRKTNGQEAIILTNGGSVEFVARSKGSGRGFTVDILVLDEAQELSDEAQEALLPTTSSAPLGNPQWIYTGTPPGPKAVGEVFTRLRADGVAGKDKRLSWHEWSLVGVIDLDDKANVAATNPAIGRRLNWDTPNAERAAMSDEGFSRERLGVWDEDGANAVIPAAQWADLLDPKSRIESRHAFALDVSPNQSSAAIAVAGLRADGLSHVEITGSGDMVDHRPGVEWVVPRLREMADRHLNFKVNIPAGSAAESLVPAITKAGVPVNVVKGAEVPAACGLFYTMAMSTPSTLRHVGQRELGSALSGASQVDVGDGSWKWTRRKSSTDITPLYAATTALWAAHQRKPAQNVW